MDHIQNSQDNNLLDGAEGQMEGEDLDSSEIIFEQGSVPASISPEVSAEEAPSSPQGYPGVFFSPILRGEIIDGVSDEGTDTQVEEQEEAESHFRDAIDNNIVNVIDFLLLKYQRKELTTMTEMLDCITIDYQEFYPLIFNDASACIKLYFGIDMVEMDPIDHVYDLVNALGITYDGMQHGPQDIPGTGLIIISLFVIMMEGGCVTEQKFWEVMNKLRLCIEWNNYIPGELRRLISENFVREGYLEYREVPGSNPPIYKFMWGLRAHAETTETQIWEFFASFTEADPASYLAMYAET